MQVSVGHYSMGHMTAQHLSSEANVAAFGYAVPDAGTHVSPLSCALARRWHVNLASAFCWRTG